MKLVTKSHVYICQETFSPVQDITIQVPLEDVQGLQVLSYNDAVQTLGRRMLAMLGVHAPDATDQ